MADWIPYSQALALSQQGTASGAPVACSECGNQFPPDQLIMLGQAMVCATCKPSTIQKMKESGQLLANQDYVIGNIGARIVARILDGIIIGAVNFIMVFPPIAKPSWLAGPTDLSLYPLREVPIDKALPPIKNNSCGDTLPVEEKS